MTTGDVIGLCGVGVAAIGLLAGFGWKLIKYLRDKPILKIDVKFGPSLHTMGDMPVGEPKQCLQVAITNIGSHPVKVSMVGGKWKQARSDGDRFTIIPTSGLPKLLTPGDSHTEIYCKPEQLGILAADLEQIWVRDSAENYWYADKKDIENLRVWGGVINK